MAQFTGKGAMGKVNVLLRVYTNAVTKDGKTLFADAQLDARDPRAAGQDNLHFVSNRTKDENGKTRFNNTAAYAQSQFDSLVAAAGDNVQPILDKDGAEIGNVYALQGDVMPNSRGNGVIVNTNKELGASDFVIDDKTMDNQYAAMKEARDAKATAKAAKAEAPAPEQTAEAAVETEAEVEANEPAIG